MEVHKDRNLQDESNKRNIKCDGPLQRVFGKEVKEGTELRLLQLTDQIVRPSILGRGAKKGGSS